jgi:PLP dependent protein
MDPDQQRVDELAHNLTRVRSRVSAACAAAGRDPESVTIIAVTKTFPAADAVRLARLGVRDIGENKDQEARPKFAEVARHGVEVRRHFVGRLQRNKARSVAGYADVIHSVDGLRLAGALGAVADPERRLDVLVQVSIDGDPSRGGAVGDDVLKVAATVAGEDALRLLGVMAVAPQSWQPQAAYQRLAEIADRLRREHPDASAISAGMSGDLEAALACGATHLRIGSALLGNRPPLR